MRKLQRNPKRRLKEHSEKVENPSELNEIKKNEKSDISIFNPLEDVLLRYQEETDAYLSWIYSSMQSDIEPIIQQNTKFRIPLITLCTASEYRNESLTPEDYVESAATDANCVLDEEDSEEVEIL